MNTYSVNDKLISNTKDIQLRILRTSYVGVYISYYCLLQRGEYCWNQCVSQGMLDREYKLMKDTNYE